MPDQSSAASEHALMQEVTAPLQTLPDDPLAIVEAEFPTAMRGYDRHAVDDYVEQVSRLVAELHATRTPEAAVRRALERVGDQISGILQRAHETAEQITTQSRIESEDRLEQARRESATMIDAAAQRVRELDADADRIWAERQRIIADAEDLSGQLQSVARDAAQRFPVEDVRTPAVGDVPEPMPMDADADAGVAPSADGEIAADEDLVGGDMTDPLARASEADPDGPGELEDPDEPEALDESPEIEATQRFEATQQFEASPRRITDDDSTQIIPPASDAAQHRRDG